MRFVAYNSKWWWALLLVFVGLLAWLFSLAWHRLPLFAQVVFAALEGGAALAIVLQLVSMKPRLRIDGDGIACHQPFYATIAWEDVVSAARAPQIEKIREQGETAYRMSLCDAWRPVDLVIRDIDKYARMVSPRTHRFLRRGLGGQGDGSTFTLRLDPTGMSGCSADMIRTIDYYLEQRGQVATGVSQPNALLPGKVARPDRT